MNRLRALFASARARVSALVMAVIVALGGAITMLPAQTATDTVKWSNPTTYTDNSGIVATDMKETRVQWGTTPGGPYDGGSASAAWPATSQVFTRAGTGIVGTRCYVMIAVSKLGSGVESVPSPETCKTVAPPPKTPNPPTNVSVQ